MNRHTKFTCGNGVVMGIIFAGKEWDGNISCRDKVGNWGWVPFMWG